jgi:hypothetical protein
MLQSSSSPPPPPPPLMMKLQWQTLLTWRGFRLESRPPCVSRLLQKQRLQRPHPHPPTTYSNPNSGSSHAPHVHVHSPATPETHPHSAHAAAAAADVPDSDPDPDPDSDFDSRHDDDQGYFSSSRGSCRPSHLARTQRAQLSTRRVLKKERRHWSVLLHWRGGRWWRRETTVKQQC